MPILDFYFHIRVLEYRVGTRIGLPLWLTGSELTCGHGWWDCKLIYIPLVSGCSRLSLVERGVPWSGECLSGENHRSLVGRPASEKGVCGSLFITR